MTKIKTLDLTKKTFQANGFNYTILESIPLSRYVVFQKIQPRLVYGIDMKTLFDNCKKAFNYLNTPKPEPANAAIVLHNMMNGMKDFDDDSREPAALLLCALFIVRDAEDIGTYDEKLCLEKIQDWKKEGYDASGFFRLALSSIPNFKQTLEEFTNLFAQSEA